VIADADAKANADANTNADASDRVGTDVDANDANDANDASRMQIYGQRIALKEHAKCCKNERKGIKWSSIDNKEVR